MKRTKKNYVNNADFYQALMDYQQKCNEAKALGKELPIVPNYIGECIMQIATRLASRGNFSGYSFKEDMIMDGVENSLKYILNFNGEKYKNPFAYFTQVIWNSFIGRIGSEKKQLYVTFKSSQEMIALGETYDGGGELLLNLTTSADYINDFITDFEEKMKPTKKKVKEEDEQKEE